MTDMPDLDFLPEHTFYGLRLNHATGALTADAIRGDEPVVLPQDGVIDPNDYKAHLWSRNDIQFSWGPKGHLLMEVL